MDRGLPLRYAGYSLLQMAIALLVVGILLGSAAQIYAVYSENDRITKTQEMVESAVSEIQTFRQAFGRYPCVASLTAARGTANYGTESDCTDLTLGSAGVVTPGNCWNGICVERTNRAIDDDGDPLTAPVATDVRVRVGAIPFRVLQMDEKDTFDAYGSRLVYVMTERMGDINTFNELQGGIAIVNENGETQVDPAGSASFLVVSPGPNKIGAFSKFGGQANVCAGSGLDLENCRDMGAPPIDATYASTFSTFGTAATTFDDFIQYFSATEVPLWRRETPTSNNIVDMADDNVGVATSSPTDELTVLQSTVDRTTGAIVATNSIANVNHESGALRAKDANKVRADAYCDKTDTNCFKTKNFVGDNDTADAESGMKCPAGEYMIGVTSDGTNAVPDCAAVRVYCSEANQALVGLNADGSPKCAAISSGCAAEVKTLCAAGDITLPATPSGNTHWYTRGDCRAISYTCSNGVWTNSAATGACTNTSTTSGPTSCGSGYSAGSTYTTTTWACGGSSSTWAADCAPNCVGYNNTESQTCNWPLTGGPFTRTVPYTCNASGSLVAGVPGAWSGSCSCGYNDKYEFTACPAGKTRKASAPATLPASGTAPATAWPNATWGGYRLNTVNTTTCSYNNPAYDTTTYCECDMTPKIECQNPSPAFSSCQKGKTGGRTVSGKYCEWKYNIVSVPKDASCNYDYTTQSILDPAVPVDRTYIWKQITGITSPNQPSGTPYPAVGSSDTDPISSKKCDCANSGITASCWVVNGSLKYDFYTCKCQEN